MNRDQGLGKDCLLEMSDWAKHKIDSTAAVE